MNALTLPDIAAQSSQQAIALEGVSMCGIASPVLIDGQRLSAKIDAGVNPKDATARGDICLTVSSAGYAGNRKPHTRPAKTTSAAFSR